MPRINQKGTKRIYRKGPLLLAGVGAVFFTWGMTFQIVFLREASAGWGNFTINDSPAADAPAFLRAFALAFPALFWGLGLLPMLYYLFARVETDEFGIADYGLLGLKKSGARWDEITRLTTERGRFPGSGNAVLEATGKAIKFPIGLPAWPLLRAEIARRLGKNLEEAARSSGVRRPPINPLPPKGRTFRPSNRIPTLFFFTLWNGFCAVMFLVILVTPGSLSEKWPFFPCVGSFLTLGVGFWLWAWNARVIVTEDGIAQFDLLNRREDLMWSEVEGYEFESKSTGEDGTTRTYVLRSQDKYIRVGDDLFRWRQLDDIILGRIPHASVVDRTEPD